MMINEKQLVAWMKALVSGDYAQGYGALRAQTPDGETKYCCLGVLNKVCELNINDGGAGHLVVNGSSYVGLPEDIQYELSGLNDDRVPFRAIANHLSRSRDRILKAIRAHEEAAGA